MKTNTQGITFNQFMQRCNEATALLEEYTYYIFRTDNNQVLARGVMGFEAAKETANELRKKLKLKWDQVKFKAERGGSSQRQGASNQWFKTGSGERRRIDYAPRYNPSKRGHFRGYYDKDGNYHDID
ncbi:hypothetical protein [Synechococcus sp. CBW1004]|uniref:hypothetical protein n=1 Tax=Synechococcus sp. CBW1004 TaxID=1353136 RepID=UPI0018CF3E7E|nr:hypothetical protein [Synechococcus sp. CBW1004]QPN64487.1 hypothetical protein H8F25_07035 [Synechococcus sp. CBW1004]